MFWKKAWRAANYSRTPARPFFGYCPRPLFSRQPKSPVMDFDANLRHEDIPPSPEKEIVEKNAAAAQFKLFAHFSDPERKIWGIIEDDPASQLLYIFAAVSREKMAIELPQINLGINDKL